MKRTLHETLVTVNRRVVCRWIDINVYRNPTGRLTTTRQLREFRAGKYFSADYHQQYLAMNPGGHCPNHSCEVSFRSAELPVR